MQSVSSRIWTRVAVFISYDDNNYTTGTSCKLFIVDNFLSLNQFNPLFYIFYLSLSFGFKNLFAIK